MRASRPNRLPQRLDYTLIPAPLDLSKPLVDDNAALPAIIVTPSSPSGASDFSIAFLAPEKKEPLVSRVSSRFTPLFKARTLFLLFLPLLLLASHVITHRLAVYRPHLHFDAHTQQSYVRSEDAPGVEVSNIDNSADSLKGWFGLRDSWNTRHVRNFIVEETEIQKSPQ